MAYRLNYSDYVTAEGPPNPDEWVGPPGPPGPVGPPGEIEDVLATGSTTPRSIEDREARVAYVSDYGGSIQAAHDALPATGGTIMLAANTTYTQNMRITISKPNVIVRAPSWNTVIRRGVSLTTGQILWGDAASTGLVLSGVTFDGNAPAVISTGSEVEVAGVDSLVQRCQIINIGGQGGLALSAAGCRADGNVITGLNSATIGGYGIWAVNHVKVSITNNRVTGARLDGIGFDGTGTQVLGNYVAGCQCYAIPENIGGGQILQYPGYSGGLIEGNFIDQGGADDAYGIELNGPNVSVIGNVIVNQHHAGIGINAGSQDGFLISGNTVLNCGRTVSNSAGGGAGLLVSGPLNNIIITGNRFADTQATPTQSWGISFYAGIYDRVVITNNDLTRNVHGALRPPTATNEVLFNNLGVDDVAGSTLKGPLTAAGITTTTLAASGAVSGAGFSTYLASPPAIGGTTAAAGTFTTVRASGAVTTPQTQSADGSGLNAAGSTFAIAAGRGTGSAAGGLISFYTAPAGSSGSGVNSWVQRATIDQNGHAVFLYNLRVAGNVGFNGSGAVAKPTVSGAKGSNAALASLLTALASYGLITDSTTA